MCARYEHHHGADTARPFDGRCWDDPETHQALITWASATFDGWALSLSSTDLATILPMAPDARVMAWVKPWGVFRPGVNPAYVWEPVLVHGCRPRTRLQPTVRDWVSANITMQKGTIGAKPVEFSHWLFQVLNLLPGDEFTDVFAGSGAVARAYDGWLNRPGDDPGTLWAEADPDPSLLP